MKRRGDLLAELGEVPGWLRQFDAAAWVDERDAPPAGWALGTPMWHAVRASERWQDAGRRWLQERDHQAAWFELTRPQAVSR